MMTPYETLTLMISASMLLLALLTFIIVIVDHLVKKQNDDHK